MAAAVMVSQLNSTDLNMLVLAADIITKRGGHINWNGHSFQVTKPEVFKSLADAAGAEVTLKDQKVGQFPWLATFTFSGVRFFAVMTGAELPIIGFPLPAPVPIAQTA